MAALSSKSKSWLAQQREYPTSDGKPMAETDWHRDLMTALIQTLAIFFAARRRVYVSGNLLLFYERGNKRKHVSPDVFVVKGVAKRRRLNYLVWLEGKGPDFIIELTSRSTRREDLVTKFELYQNMLQVTEYFLFDPLDHYLKPSLQGYRLQRGLYVSIEAVENRPPSEVLGLHLERDDKDLRLYNPSTGRWLPTPSELAQQEARARHQAEAEVQRLQREIDELRRRLK